MNRIRESDPPSPIQNKDNKNASETYKAIPMHQTHGRAKEQLSEKHPAPKPSQFPKKCSPSIRIIKDHSFIVQAQGMELKEIPIDAPKFLGPARDAWAELGTNPGHLVEPYPEALQGWPLLGADGKTGHGGQQQHHVHLVGPSPFFEKVEHVGILQGEWGDGWVMFIDVRMKYWLFNGKFWKTSRTWIFCTAWTKYKQLIAQGLAQIPFNASKDFEMELAILFNNIQQRLHNMNDWCLKHNHQDKLQRTLTMTSCSSQLEMRTSILSFTLGHSMSIWMHMDLSKNKLHIILYT